MELDSATVPLEMRIAALALTSTVEPSAPRPDHFPIETVDRPPKGARARSSAGFCRTCRQQFERRRSDQQHCSSACRAKASREARRAELSDWIDAIDRALDDLAKRHGIERRPDTRGAVLRGDAC